MDPMFIPHLLNALVYSALGIVIFFLGFVLLDWWTPYDLWKEIVEDQNTALAIMVAGVSVGICIIIAASVHG